MLPARLYNATKIIFSSSILFLLNSPASAADRAPSVELTRPGGLSGALQGGGTAFNSDMSALDSNPAGLALIRDVTLGGEFFWEPKYALASEGGIIDSKMTNIAAGFKFRQATKHTGGADRRYTLGFAGQPGESPFLIGLSGDYIELKSTDSRGKEKKEDAASLRAGAIYRHNQELQFAISSGGYFSSPEILKHTLGAALGFAENYVGTADLNIIDNEFRTALFGITVLAKGYLDLSLSYGYDLSESIHSGAFGIVVKSDVLRLFYTIAKDDLSESNIAHSAGARASIQF